MSNFAESAVESAALTWLESLSWRVKHDPEIAPGTLEVKREDFGQVVLTRRLPEALSPKPINFLWH